ncbi:translation initiation factor IF-2-like [Bubalus kerabau]|uniref:translation initiation factor IF-2-like n=1 Tax=Bubalus bubalis TaxID=89462 RepID=UPI001D10E700|nr:translation initiation factor IF-2-like [Bubalus bubalis]XP_055443105.1 translation initiation factor IF-2-like [Bubalus carabanensis]
MVTRPPAGEEARRVVPTGRGPEGLQKKGGTFPRQDQSGALTAPAPQTSQTPKRLSSRSARLPSTTAPRAGTAPHQGGGRSPTPRGCLRPARPGPVRCPGSQPVALAADSAQARRPRRDASPASTAPAAPAPTSRPNGQGGEARPGRLASPGGGTDASGLPGVAPGEVGGGAAVVEGQWERKRPWATQSRAASRRPLFLTRAFGVRWLRRSRHHPASGPSQGSSRAASPPAPPPCPQWRAPFSLEALPPAP